MGSGGGVHIQPAGGNKAEMKDAKKSVHRRIIPRNEKSFLSTSSL